MLSPVFEAETRANEVFLPYLADPHASTAFLLLKCSDNVDGVLC